MTHRPLRLPLSLRDSSVVDADGRPLLSVDDGTLELEESLSVADQVVELVNAASALADALREVADGPAARTMTEKSRGAALRALNLVERLRADR